MAPNTTQAKPFVCRDCDIGTATREGMKSHIVNIHEQIKPFICADCTDPIVSATRPQYLEEHTLKAHNRKLVEGEDVGDITILNRVKAKANLSEVAAHPPLAQGASTASHALPAPPAASAPAHNPTVALSSLRTASEQPAAFGEPEAPTPDVPEQKYRSWDDEPEPIPGYFPYYGVGFNTGPDIPGGNRRK
ncbi:hypothetical protein E4T43_03406 [Aureobasidium subglaciale]|nr:hypothetical protein E4T43_03406 [Aureobasidium subglaciale]